MKANFFECSALVYGSWTELEIRGQKVIRLGCPACARAIVIERHRVQRNGVLEDRVECPSDVCSFASVVKLENWKKKEGFNMKKFAYTLLIVALLGLPSVAAAGVLDLGEVAEWVWKTSKERGTIGAAIDLNGDKTIAGAFKLNKNGWGPAYALAGVEIVAQNEKDAIAALSNNQRVRLFLSPAVDVLWFWRKIRSQKKLKALDLLALPDHWELLAGPTLRIPTTAIKHFTWKGNTAFFLAMRVKIGNKPADDGSGS